MKKKITAAALALCLVLGLLPMSVLAAQYKGTLDGSEITIDVDDTTGEYQGKTILDHYTLAPGTITLTSGKLPSTYAFKLSHYGEAPGTITVNGTLVDTTAQTFTVTFAAGDHGTGEKAAETLTVPEGASSVEYTLPEVTGFTPETGYVFSGWLVGSDTTAKAAGTKITVSDSVTLTAQWEAEGKKVETVTLTPDKDGNVTVNADDVTVGTETETVILDASKEDSAAVTIPSALVSKMTASDANVQHVEVQTSAAVAEVPVAVLPKTGDVKVEVKAEAKPETKLPADTDAVVKTAVTGAKAVTVTVTVNGQSLLPKKTSYAAADPAISIAIKGLKQGSTYVVLCISDGALTSFGRFANITGTMIDFKSRHLSDFIAVEETAENAAALAAVTADPGNPDGTTPVEPEKKVHVTFTAYKPTDAGYAKYGSGKLELTGLEADKWYTVQLGSARTPYQIYQVVQANTAGAIELRVQTGLQMTLFYLGDNADTFQTQMAKGPALTTKTAIALSSCTGAGADFVVDTAVVK